MTSASHQRLTTALGVTVCALAVLLLLAPLAAAAKRTVPAARGYTAWAPGKGPAKVARPGKVKGSKARRRQERTTRREAEQLRGRAPAAKRSKRRGATRRPAVAPKRPRARASGPSAGTPFARGATLANPFAAIVDGLNDPGLGPAQLRFEPDAAGAIGPEHYVQIVNGQGVGVFRRSDLGLVARVDAATFLGKPDGEIIDPNVIWDEQTQRFFYSYSRPTPSASSSSRQGHLAFGWSRTADPSDVVNGWCHFEIATGSIFDDNPKLGDTASHLVLTTSAAGPSGDFARVLTVPKPASGPACGSSVGDVQTFGSPTAPLRSADGDKVDWPVPSIGADGGSTGWVLAGDRQSTSSQIMAWTVSPAGTLVQAGNLGVRSFRQPSDAPQPGGFDRLDTQDGQLLQAVAVRDPAANAVAVWTAHTIDDPAGGGRSVVRWYELVPSRCGSGSCPAAAVRQEGELKDPANHVFNAAISPTMAGNEAVVHYNVSGTGLLPQVRMRSRDAGSALDDFGPEVVVETSDAASADGSCGSADGVAGCRWGDYASATPDPAHEHLVWGSNMAVGPQTPGVTHWKTRNFAVRAAPTPVLVHGSTALSDAGPGGDGDGLAEPGETVEVRETVRNAGDAPATGTTGALSSRSPLATVPSGTTTFPDLVPGAIGAGASPFRATVAGSASCTQTVKLALTLEGSGGRHVVPVSVPLGNAVAPVSRTSVDVPKAIPDNSSAGVTSAIEVGDPGTVGDVDVSIDGITHGWVGDLRLELIAPDGTAVLLTERPGGADNGGDNLTGTVFDDEAPAALSTGTAPYTGRFKPQASLSALDGKEAKGTWRLRVSDLTALDKGTLNAWGTSTTPPRPAAAPTPTPPGGAAAAAPVSVASTDVPKAIPDNAAAGVLSTLSIGQDITVGDLDVSVSGLTHGWVGDLKLELVGPDGTTVPLADRPGGPDNGGDHLRSTVFDDEASAALSAGRPPYTGTFRATGSLATFDGKLGKGTWQLRVSDHAALDRGTLDGWGITISPPAVDGTPGPDVRSSADVPKAIPDNAPAGVTSALPVDTEGRVADLDVTVAQLRHTWVGDLRIELIGPDGTRALLADRPGGGNNAGDNLVNTVFDDEAAAVISAGAAPYTGAYRPQSSPLSVFDGKDARGTWSLRVADLAAQDTGSLVGWGTRLAPAAAGGGGCT